MEANQMEANQKVDLNFYHVSTVKVEQLDCMIEWFQQRQRELVTRQARGDITEAERDAESVRLDDMINQANVLKKSLANHADIYFSTTSKGTVETTTGSAV